MFVFCDVFLDFNFIFVLKEIVTLKPALLFISLTDSYLRLKKELKTNNLGDF